MQLQRLQELVRYDPITGHLYNVKSSRLMLPDNERCVSVHDPKTKQKSKIKVSKLCWMLGNAKVLRSDQRILHRNLKDDDYRLCNLLALPRSVFSQLTEAQRNLGGHLKLNPHPEDQLSYVLTWREAGVDRKEVVHDIVTARQKLLKLQLRCAKLLSKYCIFD